MAVEVSRDADGVALVTVSRPEALNALNTETNRELLRVATMLAEDPGVRAVVLTGGGDKSVRGRRRHRGDARHDVRAGAPLQPARRAARAGRSRARRSRGSPPSTASPSAAAASWRCLRLHPRAETAKFGQPEVGLGIIPASAARSASRARGSGLGQVPLLQRQGDPRRRGAAHRPGTRCVCQGRAHGTGDEAGARAGRQELAGNELHEAGSRMIARPGYRRRPPGRARPVRAVLRQRGPERGHGRVLEKRPPHFTGH